MKFSKFKIKCKKSERFREAMPEDISKKSGVEENV